MQSALQGGVQTVGRMPVSLWRGVVMFFAAAWLAHSAASLFWVMFPLPEVPQPTKLAEPLKAKPAKAGTKAISFDKIASLSGVFGLATANNVAAQPVSTPQPQEKIATTKLRLKLHGIFASSDPKKGSAIVADGSEQELYGVGDEIAGNRGVKLDSVYEKRVVLDNKGTLESLWLFSEEDFSVSARSTPVRRQEPARPANAPTDIRRTARPDQIPKNIGDVVRFSVHREGGKMVGYRVRPGRDRELFTQVGLKPNDIVTSVNGIEVNDPRQIRSVYKSMKTATEAQLTVLRDGITHSITISLDSGA